ncbi:hypothetical protein [Cellulosilyticum ruminicola]|uniref:hypothetical protein n=1 Tax=Cellulosilyticum ruminicola TaxID=425254 RepID=UPI0006D1652A|nr:hypothetical protein [Cellulosilyticum ruminicola]
MKLECTKEEFKVLMDLVYAGNLLINGPRSKEARIEKYLDMEQKMFAMAKEEFGLEELVEYDEEFEEYMPTHEYEEDEFNEYIDEYDTSVFWEELVMRLARRDALNYAGDVDQNVSPAALRQMQLKWEEQYEEEIADNGIMNLKIVKIEE